MKTTRGVRNNNPGNLRYTKTAWQGKVTGSQKRDAAFEEFTSMVMGLRALIKTLQYYIRKRGLKTIPAIIKVYAPSFENNTHGYIERVIRQTGISATTELDAKCRYMMLDVAEAICIVENAGWRPAEADLLEAWRLANK